MWKREEIEGILMGKPFIFERKLRSSGGTTSLIIPPDIVKNLNWKVGCDLSIEAYIDEEKIVIKRKTKGSSN